MACAAALAATSLGGCATISSVFAGSSVAQSAPLTTEDAEKALTVAHLAHQAIGVSLKAAADSGALHGADAAKAQALFDRAGAALDAADQADALANASDVMSAVEDAEALISQIDALIPK